MSPKSPKPQPMRKCVGCGERKTKKELIRVVRTPEGAIALDATGRLNGRGAYICPSQDCLAKAVRNRGLERSLDVRIPEDIFEGLRRSLLEIEQ